MVGPQKADIVVEDDYDEGDDSDFEGGGAEEDIVSTSSDEEETDQAASGTRAAKRRKLSKPKKVAEETVELDSGDEATIKEREKDLKKQKKRGEEVEDDLNDQTEGWRAKTRSMRDRDKEEKKKSKLATIKGSTIDVDKIWEDMNRPKPSPYSRSDDIETADCNHAVEKQVKVLQPQPSLPDDNASEEMITIKRTYQFAGEKHTEEKVVPKSSAEAKLWLSQQSSNAQATSGTGATLKRPLRKTSRFDPNRGGSVWKYVAGPDWRKMVEAAKKATEEARNARADGPKLNTVEKSKQDWAVHVDQEGLQEELKEAAKAKGGYLGRQDFLNEVEQRKEEEARAARLKSKV